MTNKDDFITALNDEDIMYDDLPSKDKTFKQNQTVYALYVNVTHRYTSFKIERGKYLGELKKNQRANDTHIHLIEHEDDEVNYLSLQDIFETEEAAEKYLSQLISKKYE